MKTLLLRPFVDSTTGNSPPISIMYVSSYLKSKSLDVKLIDNCIGIKHIKDLSLKNHHIKTLINNIKKYDPDIIGMTLFSRELNIMLKLCRLLKKELNNPIIVLGGPHPTVMPKETLDQISGCDIVVRGEGEVVFYDLIDTLSKSKNLNNVKGISFREKDKIIHCKNADIIDDLDKIPFPDRASLIQNYKKGNYSSLLYGSPSDIMMTSRGCPFKCNFCFKVCGKYRSRSPENVLKEIGWIVKNISPQFIQIMDDSFTIQRGRCIKILDLLIKKKYFCKFKIRSRVDAVDEEILRKMKKAGVDTVVYGFESGSQKILDAINKQTKVEQNIKSCKLTKKAGINCLGDMILFYPGETRKTLEETKQFIKKAKPTGLRFYVLTPLPKTKVYDDAKKQGTLVGDWKVGCGTPWVKLDEFKNVDEMEKISKRMFIETSLTSQGMLYASKSFLRSLLKNPYFTLKSIVNPFMQKNKY